MLPTVPKEQRTRVAHFLEKQGFRKQALAVSTDPEHKFDLAIHLGDLATATALAKEAASEQKWKQLAELATSRADFDLAQQCLHEAQDHGGLLLLATAAGNADMVEKLGLKKSKNEKEVLQQKACVVGDTVGDPFKDTSGPALNILIKLMTVFSLTLAPVFRDDWETYQYGLIVLAVEILLVALAYWWVWIKNGDEVFTPNDAKHNKTTSD